MDDDDPLPPVQKPRGYGGVATLYRNNIDLKTRRCLDGGSRVVVTEVLSDPPLCILNVYTPSRNTGHSESYDQTLSEIQEILNKYTTTHAVLLLGDMNASLKCRPNNAQDVKLKKICEINNLLSKQKGQHTFLHVNGKDSAEIDYILFNVKAQSLIRTVKTETYTDINTSDHISVTSTLKFKAIEIDKNIAEIKVKPKWEKCDTQLYSYYIANQLHPFNSPQSDYEFMLSLGQFVSTLKNAVKISIPGHKDSRRVNPVKVRVWNEEICTAVKMCKSAWWQWRMAGEPENADHPLSQHVKKCKRNLRKAQRQAEARRRIEQSERIMASTGIDKEFYRLVKHQRKTQNSTLPFITVDNKMMDIPEDICAGWATYFQGLATPSNNENYDDVAQFQGWSRTRLQTI